MIKWLSFCRQEKEDPGEAFLILIDNALQYNVC